MPLEDDTFGHTCARRLSRTFNIFIRIDTKYKTFVKKSKAFVQENTHKITEKKRGGPDEKKRKKEK